MTHSKPKAQGLTPSPVPADYPSFLREEVVGVLGPCPALRDSIFVRRRHIMEAYGLSAWTFRQLVMSKRLTPKHFVFRETVKEMK